MLDILPGEARSVFIRTTCTNLLILEEVLLGPEMRGFQRGAFCVARRQPEHHLVVVQPLVLIPPSPPTISLYIIATHAIAIPECIAVTEHIVPRLMSSKRGSAN